MMALFPGGQIKNATHVSWKSCSLLFCVKYEHNKSVSYHIAVAAIVKVTMYYQGQIYPQMASKTNAMYTKMRSCEKSCYKWSTL